MSHVKNKTNHQIKQDLPYQQQNSIDNQKVQPRTIVFTVGALRVYQDKSLGNHRHSSKIDLLDGLI